MPENSPKPADVRQLRTQAKERLPSLQTTDPSAKLADAQRQIARENGYPSWPKLVDALETPVLLKRLQRAIERGDVENVDRLLGRHARLRKRLDEPMFGFDAPPIIHAAQHPAAVQMLPVLVRHGADPNGRSKWWAGGFSALDSASPEIAELLLHLGAKWDVWSAAGHGQLEVLRGLLDADPSLVSAPGGDGETPLHFAKTPEVAALLIERGAELESRDLDHESTPLQYQIGNPEVARLLVEHGAKPDAFTAAALDDVAILERVLRDDPDAAPAHVGRPPFTTVKSNGGHIYLYKIGGGKTPMLLAAERGSRRVLAALRGRRLADDLIAAAWLGDESEFRRVFHGKPEFEPEDHAVLGAAVREGRMATVRLLLEAGLDPLAPAMDSGTSLHVAAWFGWLDLVRLLIDRVPLDRPDANHGSPPLGWALHGAQWCRNPKGDYPGVVEALLAAGADPKALANSEGASMLDQAGEREDVKDILRKHLS